MIATNNAEIEVFEAGIGGVPLLLVHGWPELAYSWRYQIEALVDAGYHCIVPNQRGYGGSSKPLAHEDYDIHHLSADLSGILDSLGHRRGDSRGSRLGCHFGLATCTLATAKGVGDR